MGRISLFVCPSCNYSAQVSGKVDFGFISRTTTIRCIDCKKLYDVQTGSKTSNFNEVTKPACPRNINHKIKKWEYPDVCPKCRTQMEISNDVVILWD